MDCKKAPRRQAGKGKENHIKKQATPSQLRANHEKQQKEGRANGERSRLLEVSNETKGSAEHGLDTKMQTLHEQADKSLDACAKKANEIKDKINAALERQDKFHQINELNNVDELKSSILKLVGTGAENGHNDQAECSRNDEQQVTGVQFEAIGPKLTQNERPTVGAEPIDLVENVSEMSFEQQKEEASQERGESGIRENTNSKTSATKSDVSKPEVAAVPSQSLEISDAGESATVTLSNNCFEPLTARLDPKTKYIALKSSLGRHFVDSPQLLEPICTKFIHLTSQLDALTLYNEQSKLEIQKLSNIKDKLSELCRELQKSNNQIRIESLDMIKTEQNKAKEQAVKIQSTLSGVMKLFDENQQRNLALKQENIELQGELKSLLEHCKNWEKCVETTLKQREIENRLVKTEMARLNLIRNEESEKYFKEKSELIKALTTMREQQSKIEAKEAKLRSDLTNYASKYDECQEIIHKGLSKFQLESRRMLKQIEQGRRDYVQLLNKYEASNKKIKQLLEEKQSWAKSLGGANNKLEALERLCRALKNENDRLSQQTDVRPSSSQTRTSNQTEKVDTSSE